MGRVIAVACAPSLAWALSSGNLQDLKLLVGSEGMPADVVQYCQSWNLTRGRAPFTQSCVQGGGVFNHGWLLQEAAKMTTQPAIASRRRPTDRARLQAALTPEALARLSELRVVCAPSNSPEFTVLRGQHLRAVLLSDGRYRFELSCAQDARQGFEEFLLAARDLDQNVQPPIGPPLADVMRDLPPGALFMGQGEPLSWKEWDDWLRENDESVRINEAYRNAFVSDMLNCDDLGLEVACQRRRKEAMEYFRTRGCSFDSRFHIQCRDEILTAEDWVVLFKTLIEAIEEEPKYVRSDGTEHFDVSQVSESSWARAIAVLSEARILVDQEEIPVGPGKIVRYWEATCGDDSGCQRARAELQLGAFSQPRPPGCYALDPRSTRLGLIVVRLGDSECQTQ